MCLICLICFVIVFGWWCPLDCSCALYCVCLFCMFWFVLLLCLLSRGIHIYHNYNLCIVLHMYSTARLFCSVFVICCVFVLLSCVVLICVLCCYLYTEHCCLRVTVLVWFVVVFWFFVFCDCCVGYVCVVVCIDLSVVVCVFVLSFVLIVFMLFA